MSGFVILDYGNLVSFLCLSFGLSALIFFLSYFLVVKRGDAEKNSPYECGFSPFGDSRNKFDVRFYLVAILFIIFDLEVIFLFPWCVTLREVGFFGFWTMFSFLFILIVGFFYEWRKGALEWK